MFCRRSLAAVLFLCCVASGTRAPQATYRTELDLGVQAYKGAKYEEAIAHFKQATAAAPEQSVFMVSIESAGLRDSPPESKVIPLPTAPMWAVAPSGSYRRTRRRGGFLLP